MGSDSDQEAPPPADVVAALAPRLAELEAEILRLRESLGREQGAGREREHILRAVVDAAPAAIVLMDELGTIVFTNAGARDLFFDGLAPDGRNFLALLANVPEGLRAALVAEGDHLFTVEAEVPTAATSTTDRQTQTETYHLSRRPVPLGGRPHTLLIVRHMTVELDRQENAVLRKAIRVIHHEFANSLTPVVSLLQSARRRIAETALAPALEQMLAVIESRVSHLNAFLSGFAALGKLPRPRPKDVPWEGFLASLRPLLADITVAPAPSGAGWFDQAQIQQVIINLVKNAREAGSPPAEIRLEVTPAPEGGHRIAVHDRGQGMTGKVLDNAMVPSFTTKPGGSGMGLALCREIVDAHQGHLRLARRDGGGVTVSLWLPSRDPATAAHTQTRLSLTSGPR